MSAQPTANGGSSADTLKGNAQAAYDQIANGPLAANVKDQTSKTGAEFSNLAASRQTPANPAATGQPLTHYHSFFSELLSWNNPRASAIAYASIVTLIFATRYLDIVRYFFKLTYLTLGATVLAEAAGKLVLGNGLASQVRPRKYYTVSRDTLDSMIGDVHELVNFFAIEIQRIVFAENIGASVVAALGAFLSYYLVKIVPYWGLALIATSLAFIAPLVYTSNQELIDGQLQHASNLLSKQTEQLRDVASKHTSQATEITKQYMGDYTTKAQQMIRGGSASPEPAPQSGLNETDFPKAPKEVFPDAPKDDIKTDFKTEEEPLVS
ncbi:Reticulon-domain-containing protein [Xylariaceae sp. FL1019]|nr:Reticulon-domain-containing protein [Xylariaceae sp. FL1019]